MRAECTSDVFEAACRRRELDERTHKDSWLRDNWFEEEYKRGRKDSTTVAILSAISELRNVIKLSERWSSDFWHQNLVQLILKTLSK
jgi:hypothetical protein